MAVRRRPRGEGPTPRSAPRRTRRSESEVLLERFHSVVRDLRQLDVHVTRSGATPIRLRWRGESLDGVQDDADALLHCTISGLPCLVEDSEGRRFERDEHPVYIQIPREYPRSNEVYFYYDHASSGVTPFHPNVVARYAPKSAGQRPGYVCLWVKPPSHARLWECMAQFVEMLCYRKVNTAGEHVLAPRAEVALEAGELVRRATPACIGPRPGDDEAPRAHDAATAPPTRPMTPPAGQVAVNRTSPSRRATPPAGQVAVSRTPPIRPRRRITGAQPTVPDRAVPPPLPGADRLPSVIIAADLVAPPPPPGSERSQGGPTDAPNSAPVGGRASISGERRRIVRDNGAATTPARGVGVSVTATPGADRGDGMRGAGSIRRRIRRRASRDALD